MTKLENYITGKWITGDGEGHILYNAVSGEIIGAASSKGLDFKSIADYARTVGNPSLRKMTFHARGNMLKALALHLRNHLDLFYKISYQTGATKADS
ncbi:MAG: phenylacetic acid degradation bifunctional protein PaaZ, partial [Chitinophagaceae bacterium]